MSWESGVFGCLLDWAWKGWNVYSGLERCTNVNTFVHGCGSILRQIAIREWERLGG